MHSYMVDLCLAERYFDSYFAGSLKDTGQIVNEKAKDINVTNGFCYTGNEDNG